jgi:hypothetical protein
MVKCCVNPDCGTEFKLFNAGELYALESRSADTEFFWLCPACESLLIPCIDSKGDVSVKARICRRTPATTSSA